MCVEPHLLKATFTVHFCNRGKQVSCNHGNSWVTQELSAKVARAILDKDSLSLSLFPWLSSADAVGK